MDTIDATLKLKSGATGTLSQSFGTTFPNNTEWAFACEKGSVTVGRGQDLSQLAQSSAGKKGGNVVRVFGLDGQIVSETTVQDDISGVTPEVKDWAAALAEGRTNKIQSPEEAVADLELVSGHHNAKDQYKSVLGLTFHRSRKCSGAESRMVHLRLALCKQSRLGQLESDFNLMNTRRNFLGRS